MKILSPLLLALLLLPAACATTAINDDPTAMLENPVVTQRVETNGDVIEEYRVAGQLKVIKVTPARGPTYYLRDENDDGKPDDGSPVSPVYWELFEWD
ncbi:MULTISPECIES: DUF2782 domain-containing protein [unclassified Lysobacter]